MTSSLVQHRQYICLHRSIHAEQNSVQTYLTVHISPTLGVREMPWDQTQLISPIDVMSKQLPTQRAQCTLLTIEPLELSRRVDWYEVVGDSVDLGMQ